MSFSYLTIIIILVLLIFCSIVFYAFLVYGEYLYLKQHNPNGEHIHSIRRF